MIRSGFFLGHPTCWEELPAELLLMIIDKLEDRSSKLRCRLVNSKWRAAGNSSLEQETLSSWTSWAIADKDKLEPPFPAMRILNFIELLTTHFVSCPLDFTKTLGNPFPSKSPYITHQSRCGCRKSNRKSRVEMFKVFTMFGSHLTSFHLHRVTVTEVLMNLILKLLDNLRALTLSSIRIVDESDSLIFPDRIVTPPPYLQYLRLININNSNFIQFYVDLCAHQLVSLEVDGFNLKPLRQRKFNNNEITDESTKSLKLNNFQTAWKNLCRLKISLVNKEFLQTAISAPVKHLYIGVWYLDGKLCLTDIIKFLENFSNTLSTLYMNVDFNHSVIMGKQFESNSVTFPCLKKIHICNPESNSYNILLAYEKNILSRCPTLEYIHWLYNSHRRFDGFYEFEKQLNFVFHSNCWQICPALRCMVVSGNMLGYYYPSFEMKFTREMFYIWEFEQVLSKLNTSQNKSTVTIDEDTAKIISLIYSPED